MNLYTFETSPTRLYAKEQAATRAWHRGKISAEQLTAILDGKTTLADCLGLRCPCGTILYPNDTACPVCHRIKA